MVTVRMFIPYMNMKSRFEAAVSRLEPQDDVRVELLHVFGTPESLSRYGDADILVARGMTYDRLRYLFPEKHVVEIQLSSFESTDLRQTGVPSQEDSPLCAVYG